MKTASVLAFVLVLFCVQPVPAVDVQWPTAAGTLQDQRAAHPAAAGPPAWSAASGGRYASLAALAVAETASRTPSRGAADSAEVPFATGAWLMGAGLVAFIICRKRFRS